MAKNTDRLGLYMKDPIKDANDTFNITTMLNDNWEKLDSSVETIADSDDKLREHGSIKGSYQEFGHVKLTNSLNSQSSVSDGVAATPRAVKEVHDKLTGHVEDFSEHVSEYEPHVYGGKYSWRYNKSNDSLELIFYENS